MDSVTRSRVTAAFLRGSPAEALGAHMGRMGGFATAAGTAGFAAAHPLGHQRAHLRLGGTGLTVSGVGFGCYRVSYRSPSHHQALVQALLGGVNLIDTSTNYTNGESERLVGEVLTEQIGGGTLRREEVVVVTKAGYLQGENYQIALMREFHSNPYPEVVKIQDQLWHCISPEFLADQLDRSLKRLQLRSVDVLLLHNPEYFLKAAHMHGAADERVSTEYYRRLGAAFLHLEEEVNEGRIAWYGISSNTFVESTQEPEFTSLQRVLETVGSVIGKEHHLQVVQLPANLVEPGAALEHNQRGGTMSALELAAEADLGVLINRPLNGYDARRLHRLADIPATKEAPPPAGVDAQLQAIGRFEESFLAQLRTELGAEHEAIAPLESFLVIGSQLGSAWRRLGSYENWCEVREGALEPRLRGIGHVMAAADGGAGGPLRVQAQDYVAQVRVLLGLLDAHYAASGRAERQAWHDHLEPVLPPSLQGLSLSQKAIVLLRSLPADPCVLVGMRQPAYVRDVIGAMAYEPPAAGAELWRRIGGAPPMPRE